MRVRLFNGDCEQNSSRAKGCTLAKQPRCLSRLATAARPRAVQCGPSSAEAPTWCDAHVGRLGRLGDMCGLSASPTAFMRALLLRRYFACNFEEGLNESKAKRRSDPNEANAPRKRASKRTGGHR